MEMNRELKLVMDEKEAIDDRYEAYIDVVLYAIAKANECLENGNSHKASIYDEIATCCHSELEGCLQDLDIIIERLKGLV